MEEKQEIKKYCPFYFRHTAVCLGHKDDMQNFQYCKQYPDCWIKSILVENKQLKSRLENRMTEFNELTNEINKIDEILINLKNKQTNHFFCLCRHENFISSDRIENNITAELNEELKNLAINYYEQELKKHKEKLKELL